MFAGLTPTLAEVLAAGNDTGGVVITNDTTVSGGWATASTFATAAGDDLATAQTTAYSVDGNANAEPHAVASGNGNAAAGPLAEASGTGSANADAAATTYGSGDASVNIMASAQNGNATANASATGGVTASAVSTAAGIGGSVSIGAVADTTRAEIQVNGLPLYTAAAGAPGGTFVSLFYVDTTSTTGGTYLWDFVTGAYVQIALALT